jgi:hypothetical protein
MGRLGKVTVRKADQLPPQAGPHFDAEVSFKFGRLASPRGQDAIGIELQQERVQVWIDEIGAEPLAASS